MVRILDYWEEQQLLSPCLRGTGVYRCIIQSGKHICEDVHTNILSIFWKMPSACRSRPGGGAVRLPAGPSSEQLPCANPCPHLLLLGCPPTLQNTRDFQSYDFRWCIQAYHLLPGMDTWPLQRQGKPFRGTQPALSTTPGLQMRSQSLSGEAKQCCKAPLCSPHVVCCDKASKAASLENAT
jgi:hypothetical protein